MPNHTCVRLYRQQHGTGNQGFRSFGVWNPMEYAISTSMVLKNGLALPLFREVQGLVCLRIRPGAPKHLARAMNSRRCLCWREPFRNCCPVHRTKPRTATEAPPWLHRSDPPATSPRPVLWCLMWLQELSYLASREHPSFRSPLSGDLVDQSQPAGCCRHRSCRRAFLTVIAGLALPAEGFFKADRMKP